MTYKNAITATKQELGRIAGVQHHTWKIRNPTGQKSIFDKPLEFEAWILKGMNHYYDKYGTEFETVGPGLMRIKLSNGKSYLRTWDDFHKEWEEYRINYYL